MSTPPAMTDSKPQPLWYEGAAIYELHVTQAVELDLQSLAGSLPIEMFGRSLFFWFKLRRF